MQYRYGTSTMEALRTLYSQGGIPRFYQGLLPALIQVRVDSFRTMRSRWKCPRMLHAQPY